MPNNPEADLDLIIDRFLAQVYEDSCDENRVVRAVVKREVLQEFKGNLKKHITRAEAAARIDEVKRAINWFNNESGYLFYLDDRIAELRQQQKESNNG